MRFSSRVDISEPNPIAKAEAEAKANGITLGKLNDSNPTKHALASELLPDIYGAEPRGQRYAREALAAFLHEQGNTATADDLYILSSTSEAYSWLIKLLCNAGDAVLAPKPGYPLIESIARLECVDMIEYQQRFDGSWYIDVAELREALEGEDGGRIRALVLINPNNPTGALYPKEVLEGIVEIARQYHLIIFSDEIYDRLVMDGGEHISIASLAPDLFCVTFSGLSKSHMIAGFRIGWMILSGAKNKAKGYIEGINMLSSMRLCSNVPAQSIVQTALGGYQSVNEYIQPGGRVYEQRDFIYKALNDIPGITAVKPKAAFYIFPKIDTEKFNIHNDEQFALDFLHEKQVLLVPGKGFNWNCPDHFRVVYLPNVRQLEKAMDKLKDFLSTYKQR